VLSRRRTEALLREVLENLERLVEERIAELEAKTANQEELNVALKVLLKKREGDRRDLEDNLMHNVKTLILANLEKLKSMEQSAGPKIYVEILESNIRQIASPLARQISSSYFRLTPAEIRITSLIKRDRTNKEIAEKFHDSESAIIYDRHNISKKPDLNNNKDRSENLSSILRGKISFTYQSDRSSFHIYIAARYSRIPALSFPKTRAKSLRRCT